MELAFAGAWRALEGKIACVRSAPSAMAATPGPARRVRWVFGRAVPDAEIRLGAADHRIPVADVHRIPAVLFNTDTVHPALARHAPPAALYLRRACPAVA